MSHKIGISATQNICWFMPLLARVQQDSKRSFPLQEEGENYALVKKVKSAFPTVDYTKNLCFRFFFMEFLIVQICEMKVFFLRMNFYAINIRLESLKNRSYKS